MSNPTDNPPTSTPPDNPPTIPADDSHDKESEPVSQDKTLPRRDPLSLNGPPPFHYGPPQPYGPPPLGAPHPAPLPFTGFEYSAAYYREKRKASRASQACTNCRQLKAKCDEQKPCQGCKDKMLECQYRDPPLSKSEREMKDISTKLDTVQGNLDRLLKCLPVFAPSRGRQPALTSLEACLGSQEPIAISPAQREILQDLKTAFSQLREYDNWDTLGPRLVWYASSLCRDNNFESPPEPLDEDDRDLMTGTNHLGPTEDTTAHLKSQVSGQSGVQSRATSRERPSNEEVEPSPAALKRKRSLSLHGEPEKPFFCFHQSCGRMYGSGKTLENHLRNHHHGRLPNLPGTCDHEANIKRFSTWEECLEHFIFHQKSGMGRVEYDRALESAEYLMSHGDQQVDVKKRISSPAASLFSGSPGSFGYGGQQSDPRALTTVGNLGWPSPTNEIDFRL